MTAVPATSLERVLALVPAHARLRDEQTGGLLRVLAEAVAVELAVLEADVAELYDSWFVETCPEWVLPYLADLIGLTDLPPDLALAIGTPVAGGATAGTSRRAFVGNTVRYRRHKGTPGVIEQVARDASGWPARVVEYQRLLAVTANVNHVRLDRPGTASLRTGAGRLDLVPHAVAQGALDPLSHTADVRRIATGCGRYGVHDIGVFLFPDQVWTLDRTAARPPDDGDEDGGWTVHPLGLDTPLYAPTTAQTDIRQLAGESELPVPLRPRRLLELRDAARIDYDADPQQPTALTPILEIDDPDPASDDPLDPSRIFVHGLESVPANGEQWQVAVDAVRGRLYPYPPGTATGPRKLNVTCATGAAAEIGAGGYDRRTVLEEVLAADADVDGEQPPVRGQVAAGPTGPGQTPLAAAIEELWRRWRLRVAYGDGSGTYIAILPENGRYDGDLDIAVPAGVRLVIVAAQWTDGQLGHYDALERRAYLDGGLKITGGAGSRVVLDGLMIEGDVVVAPGSLASLALSQCTLAGDLRVSGDKGGNPGIVVRLVRTACLPVRRAVPATSSDTPSAVVDFAGVAGSLRLLDSSLDPPDGRDAVRGFELEVVVDGSTVRGPMLARTLDASNSLLDGPVTVRHRQTGGLRYCYAPTGSRVPRRYRCIPAADVDTAAAGSADDPRPVYASTDPGSPAYLALGIGCPAQIAHGGEGGSEPGVHHHLGRPLRRQAAQRLLADFVPVGLEYGVFAPLPE